MDNPAPDKSHPFSASVLCMSRQNRYCFSVNSVRSTGARISAGML